MEDWPTECRDFASLTFGIFFWAIGEANNVFSEGFIHLTSEDKPRQVLFVAGYTQHETRPIAFFPGAGIGETLFMHREEGR